MSLEEILHMIPLISNLDSSIWQQLAVIENFKQDSNDFIDWLSLEDQLKELKATFDSEKLKFEKVKEDLLKFENMTMNLLMSKSLGDEDLESINQEFDKPWEMMESVKKNIEKMTATLNEIDH